MIDMTDQERSHSGSDTRDSRDRGSDRGSYRPRGSGPGRSGGSGGSDRSSYQKRRPRRRFTRRKVCFFCSERIDVLDYKDEKRLRRFITEQGKILPRRITGTCSQHQRTLTTAIKRARNVALLPYKSS